jgi:hypothetical protein
MDRGSFSAAALTCRLRAASCLLTLCGSRSSARCSFPLCLVGFRSLFRSDDRWDRALVLAMVTTVVLSTCGLVMLFTIAAFLTFRGVPGYELP